MRIRPFGDVETNLDGPVEFPEEIVEKPHKRFLIHGCSERGKIDNVRIEDAHIFMEVREHLLEGLRGKAGENGDDRVILVSFIHHCSLSQTLP